MPLYMNHIIYEETPLLMSFERQENGTWNISDFTEAIAAGSIVKGGQFWSKKSPKTSEAAMAGDGLLTGRLGVHSMDNEVCPGLPRGGRLCESVPTRHRENTLVKGVCHGGKCDGWHSTKRVTWPRQGKEKTHNDKQFVSWPWNRYP